MFFNNYEIKSNTVSCEFYLDTNEVYDEMEIKKELIIKTIFKNIFTIEYVKVGFANKTIKNWCIKNEYLLYEVINNYIIFNKLVDLLDFDIKKENDFYLVVFDASNLLDIKKITYKDFTITKEVIYNNKECFVLTSKVDPKIENLKDFENYLDRKIKANKSMHHYGLCKDLFGTFLKDNLNNAFLTYPTTYGIGVLNLLFSSDEAILKVSKILTTKKINFKNELSDKKLVLRFKISKAKLNLLKI
jgi:hypothetical protein